VIYLDNNSTTRIDPAVLDAMLPYFTTKFGNPSNTIHDAGAGAAEAVAIARGQVAQSIGASPREIVFTSGATESNNLALLGVCR
jgi:cysteine desulfurase